MAVNKVEYGGKTLIDLTGDTIKAEDITEGIIAHNAAGEQIIGTLLPSLNIFALVGDEESNLYAELIDGTAVPQFDVDTEGNVYLVGPEATVFEVDSNNNIYVVVGGTE